MSDSRTSQADTVILLVGAAAGIFAGFCPSWFTVASPFFHEQEAKNGNVKRIRWGEIAASIIVIAMGAAISHQERTSVPLVASIGISAMFVGGYEYMIAHPSTMDGQSQDGR